MGRSRHLTEFQVFLCRSQQSEAKVGEKIRLCCSAYLHSFLVYRINQIVDGQTGKANMKIDL